MLSEHARGSSGRCGGSKARRPARRPGQTSKTRRANLGRERPRDGAQKGAGIHVEKEYTLQVDLSELRGRRI